MGCFYKSLAWTALLLLTQCFFISCNRKSENNQTKSELLSKEIGYLVPKDSITAPRIIKASNPRPLSVQKNVINLSSTENELISNKVLLAQSPTISLPGKNGLSNPISNKVTAVPFIPGLPKVSDAYEITGFDSNPENFSSFNKLQGFNSNVGCINQDKEGNLWFGTKDSGITKYDGETFSTYSINEGLTHNNITAIYVADNGDLWIGTWGGGITKFDGQNFTNFNVDTGLNDNYILSLTGDGHGNIWIGTYGKGLSKYDGQSFTTYTDKQGLPNNYINCLLLDENGDLWIGTRSGGITLFDGTGFRHYNLQNGFTNEIVIRITEDSKGNVWLGTENGSIYKYNENHFTSYLEKKGQLEEYLLSITADNEGLLWFSDWGGGVKRIEETNFIHYSIANGLRNTRVQAIFVDDWDNIWFGTREDGIYKFNGHSLRFLSGKDGIEFPSHGMLQHSNGNIWIGMYGGGIANYSAPNNDSEENTLTIFTAKESNFFNLITSLLEDKNGNIWFATWGGTVHFFDGVNFYTFSKEQGFYGERINTILEDSKGNIWIGTDFNGLCKYDGKTFTYYSTNEGISHKSISCSLEDRHGSLWFGTQGGGLTRFDGESFSHFTIKEGLKSNFITSLIEDQKGNLWIGTSGNGISMFNGEMFTHFNEEDGLIDNTVQNLMEDHDGNIWAGTVNGLSKLSQGNTGNMVFTNLTYEDGFGAAINSGNCILQDKVGDIWVANGDKLTIFNPKKIRSTEVSPKIRLTDLSLFNERIAWAEIQNKKDSTLSLRNGRRVLNFKFNDLSRWYGVPKGLSLAHNNNDITLDFCAITTQSPRLIEYKYLLEGRDINWSSPSYLSKASFSNLPPGDYNFRARAFTSEGQLGDELRYGFSIRLPWWRSWLAYLCYLIILGSSIIATYRYQLNRKFQKLETSRLKELDTLKTKLYTNIAHELRTPLTVILGTANNMLETPKSRVKKSLKMILRNGENLLLLVNQILDLSKIESGKLNLKYQQADVLSFLKYLTESFHSWAEKKGIKIHLLTHTNRLYMDYDEFRLQQIFSNLISNAIKFTPEGGHIYISTIIQDNHLVFKIRDTGIGIPERDLPKIFDRFFQSTTTHTRQVDGTGIGLALTKELVRLMEGTINVESLKGRGAEFEVSLPIKRDYEVLDPSQSNASGSSINFDPYLMGHKDTAVPSLPEQIYHSDSVNQPVILIADDNRDVRTYISNCLIEHYAVASAKDGQECEELSQKLIPDIIILDVMMPYKDGFEVCRNLKKSQQTSHIPIIMLTAKADLESKLKGLEQGADDYLSKPFHKKELLLRIRNLFELRKQLQDYYRASLEDLNDEKNIQNQTNYALNPVKSEISVPAKKDINNPSPNNLDHNFVIKIREEILKNIEDPDFNVEKLCILVGLSNSQVHRKLSALTGLSATHFIRYIKLIKAKDLMLDTNYTLSAIAYDCGFNDPSYFSRVFKKEFGLTPQTWRERKS